MKKLNRKGFTLIELLAVIVVLAIVLVVTIPSVLSSMSKAREEQFKNAVATVEEYMKKQIDACNLGDTTFAPYEKSIFISNNGTCEIKNNNNVVELSTISTIVKNAGYTLDINNSDKTADFASINISKAGKVTAATAGADSKFSGATYSNSAS